jgi:Cu+-exporting ATPase
MRNFSRPNGSVTGGDAFTVGQEEEMEKDVVCGMLVDPAKAAATSEYNGKTYYFCAKACKIRFDANPAQYVK